MKIRFFMLMENLYLRVFLPWKNREHQRLENHVLPVDYESRSSKLTSKIDARRLGRDPTQTGGGFALERR